MHHDRYKVDINKQYTLDLNSHSHLVGFDNDVDKKKYLL